MVISNLKYKCPPLPTPGIFSKNMSMQQTNNNTTTMQSCNYDEISTILSGELIIDRVGSLVGKFKRSWHLMASITTSLNINALNADILSIQTNITNHINIIILCCRNTYFFQNLIFYSVFS